MSKDVTPEDLAALIERATTDVELRERLLASPKDTLAAELGIELAEDIVVKAVSEAPNELCIVLPPVESGELTDDELEAAAGGFFSISRLRVARRLIRTRMIRYPMAAYTMS